MEQAYRLRHHSFQGKTEAEAAEIMGVSPATIRGWLWELSKIAPQLFPILTPGAARAWHLWCDEGLSYNEVAEIMDLSVSVVRSRIQRVKKRLGWRGTPVKRMVVVDPHKLETMAIVRRF